VRTLIVFGVCLQTFACLPHPLREGRGDGAATGGVGMPAGAGGGAGAWGGGAGANAPPDAGAGMDGVGSPLGLCRIELTCPMPIVDDPKVSCGLAIHDPAGTTVYRDQAGVELRGRTSLAYPKKNYGVELWTAAGGDNPVPIMGMGEEADWIFDGSWADRSFVRNDLVFALYRDLGHYAPESRYCTLVLDGEPRGIYRLVEKIKRDDGRLAIAADDGTGSSFIVAQDEDGVLDFPVGGAIGSEVWELVYPKQGTAGASVVTAVQAWLEGLSGALTGADPGNATTGVFAYLDLDATVDFVLVEELSKNIDAYNLSLTVFRSAGGKAGFVPWDFDLSFGQPTTRSAGNDAPSGWVQGRTTFITNLCRVPALLARLGPRWRQLRAGPLSDARVFAKLDAFAAVLSPGAVDENFTIWPIAEIDFQRIYRPYSFYRVASHAEEMLRLRDWIRARLAWIDAHIDAYPIASG
jgi:hypothetical protein